MQMEEKNMQTVYDLGNGMRLVDLSKLVDPRVW